MAIQDDHYIRVANLLIEKLEQGTAPWQKPWQNTPVQPINPTTGKYYKGGNRLYLMMQGYSDPRWMTFKQANAIGVHVRQGEKSTPVLYAKFEEEHIVLDSGGAPVLDEEGIPLKETVQLERPKFFLHNVFNAEQLDGLEPLLPQERKQSWENIARVEALLKQSGAQIEHRAQNQAYYNPSTDSITLPEKTQFKDEVGYYSTCLHELGHWTGHTSRLNRKSAPFGTKQYAKEELRAEISSMLLSDLMGIPKDIERHAAYVDHWITLIKNNPNELFKAASDADTITRFLLTFDLTQEQVVDQVPDVPLVVNKPALALKPEDRRYLVVPYREKEQVKALGGKWDRSSMQWYVSKDVPMAQLERWIPKEQETAMSAESSQRSAGGAQTPAIKDSTRIYLDVPRSEKDQAKEAGARWDRIAQSWYVGAKGNMDILQQWLPPQEGEKDTGQRLAGAPSPSVKAVQKEPSSEIQEKVHKDSTRTYLAIPYREREKAKQAGARWDNVAKSWYAHKDAHMDILQQWLPERVQAQQAPAMPPHEEFAEFLRSVGCIVEGNHPIMDGKSHRIAVEGDKQGTYSGFYVGHYDGCPAGYVKNHRTGDELRWKAQGMFLSQGEQETLRQALLHNREEQQKARLEEQEQTAQRTLEHLRGMQHQVSTPYLEKKGLSIQPGVFLDDYGTTCIPMVDIHNKVWSMQTIAEDGTKRFAKGGRKNGCFHPIGGMDTLKQAETIVIAEGYATAASIREAIGTQYATVVAFDSGNLSSVAKALRESFPEKNLIIAGDDDQHLVNHPQVKRNPGREKAEAAAQAVGGKALFPVFAPGEREKDPSQFTDFNDLAQRSALGKQAVTRQIRTAINEFAQARMLERARQASRSEGLER